ncbi:MAG: ornithine carbamoyltransferase [Gammaproteobacteria bacterium]
MLHFLNFADLDAAAHRRLLDAALSAKSAARQRAPVFAGRMLLMIFQQPSTRTRVSFAAAMAQGGGSAQIIDAGHSQMSRQESVADTARAVSGVCDAVMIRAVLHSTVAEFARFSHCPVINGLSDLSHPCQVLADVLTCRELKGGVEGLHIAWVGDCNNVFYSWAQAAVVFGCHLTAACPPAYRPQNPPPGVVFADAPAEAADNADVVMTDVWASMGDEQQQQNRAKAFAGYSVNHKVMAAAKKDAIFLHCLPAHRGEEVSAEVMDGKQSAVWQQAENRMHAQKALLQLLFEEGK